MDLNLLVNASTWSNPNTTIRKGTKAIKLSCPSGIPIDRTIINYTLTAQLIFKSRKVINVTTKVVLMKDPVVVTSI